MFASFIYFFVLIIETLLIFHWGLIFLLLLLLNLPILDNETVERV
jgi:hypothetical protein